MDQDPKVEGASCSKEGCGCKGGGCGCGAGKGGCGCACKMIKVFFILLLGGVIGYLLGARCGYHAMCPMSMMAVPAVATK